jgi:hypothetical protein
MIVFNVRPVKYIITKITNFIEKINTFFIFSEYLNGTKLT